MPTTTGSPSLSPTSSSPSITTAAANPNSSNWWESVSKARSAILSLASLLPPPASSQLASLSDSDRPAFSLLSSHSAYSSLSLSLSSSPHSGSGSDPLCHWLYDTYLSSDSDLRLIVLSFLPLISSLYLSRLPSPPSPLSGFEAVLLAIYSSEVKSRGGKPLLVSVPDLSLPSLYHTPDKPVQLGNNPRSPRSPPKRVVNQQQPSVSVLSPPLEPQVAVKSTKRAAILAACFDAYYSKIALMPPCSKVDLCKAVTSWAGQFCPCRFELDQDQDNNSNANLSSLSPSSSSSSLEVKTLTLEQEDETSNKTQTINTLSKDITNLDIGTNSPNGQNHCNGEEQETREGSRVSLPWELLQPLLRILGHCLLAPLNPKEVRDSAAVAVRCVYARAVHDVMPQSILAARSLIQLDKSARATARATGIVQQNSTASGSNMNTPSKQRRPEVMLVSK